MSEFLRNAITNMVLSHRLLPVEGYEFPQEEVAEFWKDVFAERGINVFGACDAPSGVHRMQMDFELPDEPPDWLVEK
jgi:hypothetical protein